VLPDGNIGLAASIITADVLVRTGQLPVSHRKRATKSADNLSAAPPFIRFVRFSTGAYRANRAADDDRWNGDPAPQSEWRLGPTASKVKKANRACDPRR
jgi:hypothetical protein